MPRNTLIFGNGLGMALNPDQYYLANAIRHVWNSTATLTEQQKQFILRCLPDNNGNPPVSEDDLDYLQLAITSSEFLKGMEDDDVRWLTVEGAEFPVFTAKFIYRIATYLHLINQNLPDEFIAPFVNFLNETRSHVATLNYDKLIYSKLIENQVVRGYDGALVDGMWDEGFTRNNLERRFDRNFGYYLHLHGSPLFVEQDEKIIKLHINQLTLASEELSRHIVLTHIKHKPSIISSSVLLTTYWDYLAHALSESEQIVLFGYSGNDVHLNDLLRPYIATRHLRIVEWSGAGEEQVRRQYWRLQLRLDPRQQFELHRLANILDFRRWE